MSERTITVELTQRELESLLPERGADVSALSAAHNQMRGKLANFDVSDHCPSCGIAREHLEAAHFTNLPVIDGCADEFHGDRLTRLEKAMERELEKRRNQDKAGEILAANLAHQERGER